MKIPIYNLELNKKGTNCLRKVRTFKTEEDLTLYSDYYNPKPFYKIIKKAFRAHKQSEEHLYLLVFNNHFKPIGLFDVAHGSLNKADWKLFNVITRLYLCNGTNFIVAHNHPNTIINRTYDVNSIDQNTTESLIKLALTLGKECEDHIIIGSKGFISLKQHTPIFMETENDYYEELEQKDDKEKGE